MQVMGNRSSLGRAALLVTAACMVAQTRQNQPENSPERRATSADVNISCRVNEATRTASVTLVNRTDDKIGFSNAFRLSYEGLITTEAGRRLPAPELPKVGSRRPGPKEGTWIERSQMMSIFGDSLGAGEQRTDELRLSDVAIIPKEGGTFHIRIGRGLFFKFIAGQLKLTNVIWCEPMTATFPPLKE